MFGIKYTFKIQEIKIAIGKLTDIEEMILCEKDFTEMNDK